MSHLCLSAITRCSTLTDQHRASRSASESLQLGVSPCVKVDVKIFTHFCPQGDGTRTARRWDQETSYSRAENRNIPETLLGDFSPSNISDIYPFSLVGLVTNPLEIFRRCAFFSSQNPHVGAAAPLCLKEARNGLVGEKLSLIVCSFSLSLCTDSPCHPFLSLPFQLRNL